MQKQRMHAEAVEAAVRRADAVVSTFDEELTGLDALLAAPLVDVQLSPEQWTVAHRARLKVEESVRSLDEAATEAERSAHDWQRRATIAERDGQTSLAAHARQRALGAEAEYRAYHAESQAAREFLRAWDVRIQADRSGRSLNPTG